MLREPPCEIPTSEHPVYCTDNTRTAEDRLGLRRSVYFYAGRAHSDFGEVVLVFGADCENGRDGSATPFDTGGFVFQPTPYIKVRLQPNDDLEHRVLYCQQSELSLEEWREAFAQILAAYFDEITDYWNARPARPDPEGLYELNDPWRSWTFEIRFYDPQPLHNSAAWCSSEQVWQELFRLGTAESNVPGAERPVNDFINGREAISAGGTPFFCREAERWVREQLQL